MNDLVYNFIPASEENRKTDTWTVVGDKGGVHIWAVESPAGFSYGETHYGGIEMHSRQAQYYCIDAKPSHTDCWLIGCDCWHDGSSLFFSEVIAPMLRFGKDNCNPGEWHSSTHSYMESILYNWYTSKFKDNENDLQD